MAWKKRLLLCVPELQWAHFSYIFFNHSHQFVGKKIKFLFSQSRWEAAWCIIFWRILSDIVATEFVCESFLSFIVQSSFQMFTAFLASYLQLSPKWGNFTYGVSHMGTCRHSEQEIEGQQDNNSSIFWLVQKSTQRNGKALSNLLKSEVAKQNPLLERNNIFKKL